jgi:putative ABC transport system permease protein
VVAVRAAGPAAAAAVPAGAVGVAFPVAMLGSILLYVDSTVQSMTAVALAPVQVEMRALAGSLTST